MDTADTTKASLSYAEQLKDSPLALEWLYARGLKPRTIKEAHLGYVGRPAPGHGRFKALSVSRILIQRRTFVLSDSGTWIRAGDISTILSRA